MAVQGHALKSTRATGRGICKDCGQPLSCETVILRNVPEHRAGWVARDHIREVCESLGFSPHSVRRALGTLIRKGTIKVREEGFRR